MANKVIRGDSDVRYTAAKCLGCSFSAWDEHVRPGDVGMYTAGEYDAAVERLKRAHALTGCDQEIIVTNSVYKLGLEVLEARKQ